MKRTPFMLFIIVVVSFLFAMILTIIPLPLWLNWCRPLWIVMVLIYWVLLLPHRVSITIAWLLGLLLDVLHGSLLGAHALALIFVAYFVAKFHIRIRLFNLVHQTLLVFMLLILYQTILFVVLGIIGQTPNSLLYWLPSFTSILFWPLLFKLLQKYYRQ